MLKKSVFVTILCLSVATLAQANVTGRYVFYNESAWDNDDPLPNGWDDGAIAPDKTALLPGQTATFANYTSYSRGINGIIVDIAALGAAPLGSSDFEFRAGNNNDPTTWTPVPDPAAISVRADAGAAGADRVTLTWSDNLIENEWLEITILDTTGTGLCAPDVFYFGNAIGETGNSPSDAAVTPIDDLIVINYLNNNGTSPAGIDSNLDFNRDGQVSPTDALILTNILNQNLSPDPLQLITVPAYDPGSCSETTIPAPGALLLGGIGVGCLAWVRRRRAL